MKAVASSVREMWLHTTTDSEASVLRQELILSEGSLCQLQGTAPSADHQLPATTDPFLTLSSLSHAVTADARDAAEDAAADAGSVRGRYSEGRGNPPVTI